MEELADRLAAAKENTQALNQLISDYLPFIKKEIGGFVAPGLGYDDKLSLGMLVFMNCVRQYTPEKGGFIRYASVSIRNRLLDKTQKLGKTQGNTIYLDASETGEQTAGEVSVSLEQYSKNQEREALSEEILGFSEQLSLFGFGYEELERSSPRQKRSRLLCRRLADTIFANSGMCEQMFSTRRLPKAELARLADVSEKTVEKYRRYIISLVILRRGDYPGIAAYAEPEKEEM